MKNDFELVKFNLTEDMSSALIEFNSLKIKLSKLKKLYNLEKNSDLLKEINDIENEMNKLKKKFINLFRKYNREEINKYLEMKDQFWSFFS